MIFDKNETPIPGVEYFWKRTDGWKWLDGQDRWWEVFVVFQDGVNGSGGACIEERWRWNGSSENLRVQPRNLTLDETRQLIEELSSHHTPCVSVIEAAQYIGCLHDSAPNEAEAQIH